VRRALLVLALCLPLAGAKCMRRPSEVPPRDAPVRVIVQNDYGSEVEVYAIGGGTSLRLGLVNPGMEGRFEVPHGMIGTGSVEFEARTSGRNTARSGPLHLQPGHVVEFHVTAQLYNSTANILN